jgi:hypothetical protein
MSCDLPCDVQCCENSKVDFQPTLAGSKETSKPKLSQAWAVSICLITDGIRIPCVKLHGRKSVTGDAKASGENTSRSDQTGKYFS